MSFVFRRKSDPWLTERIHGEDVSITLRRPHMTDWADLLDSIPTYLSGVGHAVKSGGQATVRVPATEIRSILDFLHLHTLAVSGVVDTEGHPVEWAQMTPEERDHFWECLPQSAPSLFVLAIVGKLDEEDKYAQDAREAARALRAARPLPEEEE